MSPKKDSLSYRRDSRSVKEFAKDLKEGAEIEHQIIVRYCNQNGLFFMELGHDDGSEIKTKSSAAADYLVCDSLDDKQPRLLEVKFCRPDNKEFKLKVHHVQSYIKQGAKILFVMGWDTQPRYTIIDPNTVVDNKVVTFWNKLAFICKTKDYQWTVLQ